MLTQLIENLLVLLVNLFHATMKPQGKTSSDEQAETAETTVIGIPVGLLPGRSAPMGNKAIPFALSPQERLRHIYACGSTGSGKTTLFLRLIEDDIASKRTFCVIDLRGDLIDRVVPRLAKVDFDRPLLLIDLRVDSFAPGLNPLAGADAHSRALYVLGIIKRHTESWGVQLEETLRCSLIALAQSGWTLLEVEPLLSSASFRQTILQSVTDSYVIRFFDKYQSLVEAKQIEWRLAVLNKLSPFLASPQMRLLFGQRSYVPLGKLLNESPGAAILISLAADRLHDAALLIGSLLVTEIEHVVTARAPIAEIKRVPISLYIDEFEAMVPEQFGSIVAEGRRFGVGLCLAHQNLTQLPAILRSVIRNNVGTQLFFRTGALDARELAKELVAKAPREDLVAALMTQPIGEAFLVRRGEKASRIRIPQANDPVVDTAIISALKREANERFCVSSQAVQTELNSREQWIYDLEHQPVPTPSKRQKVEVRHGKKEQFHPPTEK